MVEHHAPLSTRDRVIGGVAHRLPRHRKTAAEAAGMPCWG